MLYRFATDVPAIVCSEALMHPERMIAISTNSIVSFFIAFFSYSFTIGVLVPLSPIKLTARATFPYPPEPFIVISNRPRNFD